MFRRSTPPPSTAGHSLLPLALLLVLLLSGGALQAGVSPSQGLLQFAAGGHVLGFLADGVYVAGADHVLHVGFVGGREAVPESSDGGREAGRAGALREVRYGELWPGVSLRYTATAGGIVESTWEVAAGAEVDRIRLRYNAPVEKAADGSLRIRYANGWMSETAPIAWQQTAGGRRPVVVAFRVLEASGHGSVVGFEVGDYDPAQPLLIDPTLAWNTFMGSADDDEGRAIAVDGSGNVYVAGRSSASWGTTPVNDHAGGRDAFVAKLNASGTRLWHTFLGSADQDEGRTIAVDVSGNIYVGGLSKATWGAPVNPHAGGSTDDAFVAKLDASGAVLWNTFMGSTDPDESSAIALNGGDQVYVVGRSFGSWGMLPKNPHAGLNDAFVARLDGDDGMRLWHTFLGSSGLDDGRAVAAGAGGQLYVAGSSDASWGAPVNPHAGLNDAFVAGLDATDGERQWHTFLGSSSGNDFGDVVTVDASGQVYLAGSSQLTWGTPVNAHAGGALDAFVAKLNSIGERQWHTFLGSVDSDEGRAIVLGGAGQIYVAGSSDGTWGTMPLNPHAGSSDAFVAELSSTGARLWYTFLGSVDDDVGIGIALDGSGALYLAGLSFGTWGTMPLNPYAGSSDALVAKLLTDDCAFFVIKSTDGKLISFCL